MLLLHKITGGSPRHFQIVMEQYRLEQSLVGAKSVLIQLARLPPCAAAHDRHINREYTMLLAIAAHANHRATRHGCRPLRTMRRR
jgi:hypothetical protein